jgi:uncharacterized protein YbaR (Trm112 family)
MKKIDITCKNCKQTLSVDRTEEIPENVKKLLCNFCPDCQESGDYYNEDYIYYELGELEQLPKDPNQLKLL